jgi:SAM-dependent methyltransferase
MTAGWPATAARDADHAGEVMRLFDAKAPGWPAKYAPDGPLAGRLGGLSATIGRHARPGDRVLDLGCGTGELARALAAGGLRVTGCDISSQMLRRAADTGDGSADWVRLEPGWRCLPFASASFDVVVAASVLEYVADPGAVLRECARVLRPQGVVMYTVPDLRSPVRWAEWCAWQLTRLAGPPRYKRRDRPQDACPSRWRAYRAYLRTSRHRHRVRWWLAVSRSAGLHPVPPPGRPGPARGARSALRLLVFSAPGKEARP